MCMQFVHASCRVMFCAFPTGLHLFNFQIQVKSSCVMYFFIVLPTSGIIAVCMQVPLCPFTWRWKSHSLCNATLILKHKMMDTVQKTSDTCSLPLSEPPISYL